MELKANIKLLEAKMKTIGKRIKTTFPTQKVKYYNTY